MAINQPYVILEQREIGSKYGGTVIRITMVGIKDRNQYTTYVDHRNRNHAFWDHITRNPHHGFVIRGLKLKKNKDFLVSADSRPIIEWQHDNPEVIFGQLKEIWDEEDRKASAGTFRDLFN
jgi:hypothetical protein